MELNLMKKSFKKIEQALLERKNELLSKNKDIDIDVDGDETDAIQGKIIANIYNQISFREKEQIKKIEMALLKIKGGTFGICCECEENIGEKRLLACPESTLCISCAEAQDFDRRRI